MNNAGKPTPPAGPAAVADEQGSAVAAGPLRHVTAETATVYRGGGRRFFTKRAAYRKAAKRELSDSGEFEGPANLEAYRAAVDERVVEMRAEDEGRADG